VRRISRRDWDRAGRRRRWKRSNRNRKRLPAAALRRLRVVTCGRLKAGSRSRGGKQGSREAGKQGKRRWGIGQAASGRQQAQQRADEAAAMAKPAERERERDVFVYHGMMHIGS
jgi:hypothetical protein